MSKYLAPFTVFRRSSHYMQALASRLIRKYGKLKDKLRRTRNQIGIDLQATVVALIEGTGFIQ